MSHAIARVAFYNHRLVGTKPAKLVLVREGHDFFLALITPGPKVPKCGCLAAT